MRRDQPLILLALPCGKFPGRHRNPLVATSQEASLAVSDLEAAATRAALRFRRLRTPRCCPR